MIHKTMTLKRKKLVLIDSNALIHRSFHALPSLTNKAGESTGAIYGYALTLLSVLQKIQPEYIAATFDLAGGTFRHEEYKEYKAHRTKAPDELYAQIPLVKEMLKAFNIPIYEKQGFEADDVIGTVVKHPTNSAELDQIIVTGDMDALQLVDENTQVFTLKKGITDTVIYDTEKVKARFDGLLPDQIVDYKALRGDASDNIPGVKGIGEKTAISLLKEFGTLEKIYAQLEKVVSKNVREKLEKDKEKAFLSQKLARIFTQVPIDFQLEACRTHDYDQKKVLDFFKKMGFFSLIKRLGIEETSKETDEKANFSTKENFKIEIIKDEKLVQKLVEEIKQQKQLAFSLLLRKGNVQNPIQGMGISFTQGRGFFIPQEIMAPILVLMEDRNILKIGYDLKKDLKTLWSFLDENFSRQELYVPNINAFENFFDVQIAAYLLHSGFKNELEKLVLEELGETFVHMINKKGQTSLLEDLGEGPMNFSAEQAVRIWQLQKIFQTKLEKIDQEQKAILQTETLKKLFQELETPLIKILSKMELFGVKINQSILKKVSLIADKEIQIRQKQIFSLAEEEFNINSPSQLAQILYEKLKIPTTQVKKGKTGYSTDADQLRKIKIFHPIVAEIEEYRELFKIKTTYADALFELVQKDGRIHASFNQAVTATGRLSSSEPNLQNIPKRGRLADLIRQAFVCQDGWVLISADYSQIDLRSAAHLADDARMIKIFEQKKDIHQATAAWVNDIEETAVTDKQRSEAKALNFGVLYGMGVYGFMRDSGVSQERAEFFINQYMEKFSGIKKYLEATKKFAYAQGFAETPLGRRRYIANLKAGNYHLRQAAERMAINLPIQGLSADIMKLAMRDVEEKLLIPTNKDKTRVKMILQIHDELIFEVEENFADEFMLLLKNLMESVYTLKVPLLVEVKKGYNWNEI